MKPYVNQLASLFLDAADTSHKPYTPAVLSQMINTIENEVLANFHPAVNMTDTSGNQGAALLSMCSIASYSYKYWYNNYDKWSDTTINQDGFHTLGFFRSVGHWLGTAGEDALGFLGAGKAGGSITETASAAGNGPTGTVTYSVNIKKAIKAAKNSSAHQRERYKNKQK